MNTPTQYTYIGIDIAKDTLVTSLEKGKATTFENTPRAIEHLIAHLRSLSQHPFAICEATGGYEIPLVQALTEAQIPTAVVMPGRVRHYAKASGLLAKTDSLDAALLAQYGQAFQPTPYAGHTPALLELRHLVDRRTQLVDLLSTEKNRAAKAATKIEKYINKTIRFIENQIAQIEDEIEKHIDSNPDLREKATRLQQVQGVGAATTYILLSHFPELGTLTRNQAAALLGVAPMNRDSGKYSGQRSIHGGRLYVRNAIYMASLSTIRFNPILKPFYRNLKSTGKPSKVAITAVMRKLIILLNQILKNPDFVLAH